MAVPQPGFPSVGAAALGSAWLGAVQNPSPRVVLAEVGRGVRGLLGSLFWHNGFTAALAAGDAGRAVAAGAIAGLAQGLPASLLGQSFVWPYLLGWPSAALPGVTPVLWCAGLLGAAAGLAFLLRREWRAAFAAVRPPVGAGSGSRPAAPCGASLAAVGAAAVPAFLLRWLLRDLTVQLDAAATVGLCLAATGELLATAGRWARRADQVGAAMPPWLAACGGLAAGASALPGLSLPALLLLAGLAGRVSPEAAGRFALMATAAATALLGLASLPGAVSGAGAVAALAPLTAGAAAVGSFAGGSLLLGWLRRPGSDMFGALGSAVAALGGLAILLGVFGA